MSEKSAQDLPIEIDEGGYAGEPGWTNGKAVRNPDLPDGDESDSEPKKTAKATAEHKVVAEKKTENR